MKAKGELFRNMSECLPKFKTDRMGIQRTYLSTRYWKKSLSIFLAFPRTLSSRDISRYRTRCPLSVSDPICMKSIVRERELCTRGESSKTAIPFASQMHRRS